ncbi:hypothetical protein [Persephonella sp.]
MIEQRVLCDKCGMDCSDNYYTLSPMNITSAGSYTTKTNVELCPSCFGLIDQFLDLDFCIPVEEYTDYD